MEGGQVVGMSAVDGAFPVIAGIEAQRGVVARARAGDVERVLGGLVQGEAIEDAGDVERDAGAMST
jgi:hypothetical protein